MTAIDRATFVSAFLDDTRGTYDPGAATDAYARTLAWFGKYLPAG